MEKYFIALVAVTGLLAIACGSDSADVATLRDGDGSKGAGATAAPTAVLDDEAAVMAFTQCMRDQGIEFMDPLMDSEGNVQKPEPIEGDDLKKNALRIPYEVCSKHLEGVTFGRKHEDVSDLVDELVELAACLRDKGFDLGDPTAETLRLWQTDLKVMIDFNDPDVQAAYERCSGAGLGYLGDKDRGSGKKE